MIKSTATNKSFDDVTRIIDFLKSIIKDTHKELEFILHHVDYYVSAPTRQAIQKIIFKNKVKLKECSSDG